MNETQFTPGIAAIEFTKGGDVDAIMQSVVKKLVESAVKVSGFLQAKSPEYGDGCCGDLRVLDIETGDAKEILQSLGAGARGCRLDPVAMADISAELGKSLDNHPDLLVLNRFGRGESEGRGLRSVLEKAVELKIPVLTAVRDPYTESLAEFGGEYCELLPMDQQVVFEWCMTNVFYDDTNRLIA